MIDTNALFGPATPEPPSSALGDRGQGGFMATLGDVLAGMLDPEGLHLVTAIGGHRDDQAGAEQHTGDDARSRSQPEAPGIAGAHLAAALRLNGLRSGPTDPAAAAAPTTPATETAGSPAAAATSPPVGASQATAAAEPQAPPAADAFTEAPVVAATAGEDAPVDSHEERPRIRPVTPTDPVGRGIGLLDPDGDLTSRPNVDDRIRSTHEARSMDGTRVAIHEVRMETDPDRARPSALRAEPAAPSLRTTPGAPAPLDRPGPPPIEHARPIPADRSLQPGDSPPTRPDATARSGAIEAAQVELAPAEGPAIDGGPSGVRDAGPVSAIAVTPQPGPRSAMMAPIVERLIQAVETLQDQPPPRSLVVEIPELDGLRIRVAVRPDGAIHLATPSDRVVDLAMSILDAARAALSERGFDLAHDSPRRRHDDREEAERPRERRPMQIPQPRGLRI